MQENSASTTAPNVDFTIDMTASPSTALQSPGGSVINSNVVIINNNGSFVTLSDISTHAGCSLAYQSSSPHLNCAYHGSNFSLSGSVLNGPATSSLKQYNVSWYILHISG